MFRFFKRKPVTLKTEIYQLSFQEKLQLADNRNTTVESLKILSEYESAWVRQVVALNKNVSEEVLINLIEDKEVSVARELQNSFEGSLAEFVNVVTLLCEVGRDRKA